MNRTTFPQVVMSLEKVTTLMERWAMRPEEWCLLDGPAIKFHNAELDLGPWRNHLNIYVKEQALPWKARELELTVPPMCSAALTELLQVSREGENIHLVPASRYYRRGFERERVLLPSGRQIEIATFRGCSQIWSYRAAEFIENQDQFEGDIERIAVERLTRLRALRTAAEEEDIRERLILLEKGYEALENRELAQAKQAFIIAAGPSWKGSKGRE